MTRAPRVVSTITKLSDDTERRLTASAGYDSFVHVHLPLGRAVQVVAGAGAMHQALLGEHPKDLLHVVTAERLASSLNGSSKAAHLI